MTDTKSELLKSIEAQTAAPVNTELGMLHQPDSLSPFGPALVEGGSSSAYSAARGTLKVFNETLTQIAAVDKQVRQPHANARQELQPGTSVPRWTVGPEHVESYAKSLDDSFARADATFTKARDTISDTISALDKEIAAKLRDPARNSAARALESESIRAHVRGLKPEKRMGFVAEAIKRGSLVEVASILGSPAVCSGISIDEHATLRTMAEQALAPQLFNKRDAAVKVSGHISQAAEDFVKRWKSFYPRPNAASTQSVVTALDALRTGKGKAA